MRTFVALRKLMESNQDLATKIRQLERKYDQRFKMVFDTIQQLIKQEKEARPIGFEIGRTRKKIERVNHCSLIRSLFLVA